MSLHIPLPSRHTVGLLVPMFILTLVGIATIHVSDDFSTGPLTTVVKQVAYGAMGVAGMLAALLIGYQRLGRFAYAFFAAGVALLVYLVMDRWIPMPMVQVIRNTRQWIRLGPVQVQPAELVKIAYILALAWYLRYRRNYRALGGLIAPFAFALVPMALIKAQRDLGTVLLFPPVLFAMLFAAGAKVRHLGVIVLLALLCAPLFWLKIEPYQRLRLAGVVLQNEQLRDYLENRPELWERLRPERARLGDWMRELNEWENNTGYQLIRSKQAIGSGRLLGQGYGQGVFVETRKLPEKHNDFIFSLVAHQWGLVGGVVLLLCYGLIVIIGFDIAAMTKDPFGRLVAVGLTSLIAVQTLTNLCVTTGLGPVTGVTLPFVSAGGSSLISSFLSVGLLLSVAHRRPILMAKRPFEFDEEAERYELAR